jgi:hypothetical protein
MGLIDGRYFAQHLADAGLLSVFSGWQISVHGLEPFPYEITNVWQ